MNTRRPRISLEQWSALVAIVEAGSHAQAAERLHKSQSTITYAVQQIELLLGVKAFEIQGRKARLTMAGELLYRRARQMLEDAAALEQAAHRLSAGWEAQVRLAVEVIFPLDLLFQCLGQLAVESPHTQVEVFEAVLGHRAALLEQGQADLAIFSSPPAEYPSALLTRMRFVPVAHPGHPLHRMKRPLAMASFTGTFVAASTRTSHCTIWRAPSREN